MFLFRVGPGQYAVSETPGGALRVLRSDPFRTPRAAWELGEAPASSSLLAPVLPGKIVGIGRNYKEHVKELSNPMPAEPVIFLKATTSLLGPGEAVGGAPGRQRGEHGGGIAGGGGARRQRAAAG